ncbi:TfoX/Sxy family protein [Demequina sp.]|uniref:TfoX/Sxy family protein n=1 Tax=Demequina sp. TaxID=2050685 RepID=UPI003D146B64
MAADPELVERLHALLAAEPALELKKMFGGVGFMVDGHLTVCALSGGGLIARVGREAVSGLLGPAVEQMVNGERPMTGWVRVSQEACEDDDELSAWVRRCLEFVRTLD